MKKAIIAPTSEFAAIPHNSILATEGFPSLVDILKISKEMTIPKMNAKKDIVKDAWSELIFIKNVLKYIPITAPRDAPAETPISPGSAKGFLNKACRQQPHTARLPPTINPIKILGSLIEFNTTSLGVIVNGSFATPMFFAKIDIISLISIFTAPMERFAIRLAISSMENAKSSFFLLIFIKASNSFVLYFKIKLAVGGFKCLEKFFQS